MTLDPITRRWLNVVRVARALWRTHTGLLGAWEDQCGGALAARLEAAQRLGLEFAQFREEHLAIMDETGEALIGGLIVSAGGRASAARRLLLIVAMVGGRVGAGAATIGASPAAHAGLVGANELDNQYTSLENEMASQG